MLLSSGASNINTLSSRVLRTDLTGFGVHSTQKTLDEGVEKMRDIYKSYDQVGIKDRSMIWNS